MEDQAGCDKCGQALSADQRVCGQCGSERPAVPGPAEGSAPQEGPSPRGLVWEADISLLTNPLILRQLVTLLALTGLFMSGLLSFLLAVQGEWRAIPTVLGMTLLVVGILAVLMLPAMLFLGNRIRARFTVNEKGVLYETVGRRARTVSRLAVLLGALGGRPTTAGAGLLGMSRERESYSWRGIVSASYHPRWRGITLCNRWRAVAFLACTPGNYEQVAAYVRWMVATPKAGRAAAARSPLPRLLGRTALVVLAALPIFLIPYPFELDPFVPLIMLCFALATVWLVHFFGWVVIATALWIAAEIVLIGLQVRQSIFASLGVYRVYEILDAWDWSALALAAAGLAYLIIFSWRAARGRIVSALGEDWAEVDG